MPKTPSKTLQSRAARVATILPILKKTYPTATCSLDHASPLELLIAHARDEVVPPAQLQADVPADLERVILRCLAKRPEDRFQDAESLEQALADLFLNSRVAQSPLTSRFFCDQFYNPIAFGGVKHR